MDQRSWHLIWRNKGKIVETAESRHYNPNLESTVKREVSQQRLGAAVAQLDSEGWITAAVSSVTFHLNKIQHKLIQTIESLWAIEHFKYYLYGQN